MIDVSGRKVIALRWIALLCAGISASAPASNGLNLIGFGTESVLMGGADVAVARDTLALNTNPAGLARIRSLPDGRTVHLSDVANVRDGFVDIDQEGYFNGEPSINCVVYQNAGQDAIRISQLVKAYVLAKKGAAFDPHGLESAAASDNGQGPDEQPLLERLRVIEDELHALDPADAMSWRSIIEEALLQPSEGDIPQVLRAARKNDGKPRLN